MLQVRRIGHITLDTPDLNKQIEYFTNIMGLMLVSKDKHRAFLSSQVGQLAVQLNQASTHRCTQLSFEISPGSDLKEAARSLAAHSITSELQSDDIPGLGQTLTFADPKGTTIQLFSTWNSLEFSEGRGVNPIKLGHVAFHVTDLRKIVQFYETVLGFRVSDWIDDYFVFMRCNPDHHTVNFLRGEADNMHHMAYELRDWAQVQAVCDFLGKKNVQIGWGPLRHGPGHNIAVYFPDGDGQIIETYCELDQMKDEVLGYFEPRPWHRESPQRPKVWPRGSGTIWGQPRTR